MIGRVATYNVSGDARALARQAEEGILPIFQAQPGFRSYTVALGDDGRIYSMSAWDTRADAETGSEAAASFVAEHMGGELELVDIQYVELLFNTALGVSTLASATA